RTRRCIDRIASLIVVRMIERTAAGRRGSIASACGCHLLCISIGAPRRPADSVQLPNRPHRTVCTLPSNAYVHSKLVVNLAGTPNSAFAGAYSAERRVVSRDDAPLGMVRWDPSDILVL